MQRIVGDRLRPADKKDAFGVAEARAQLARTLDYLDGQMAERTWAIGEAFTIADCAAAPALYYADKVLPFAATHPNVWAHFERLKARPSFVRTLKEAEPYFHMFPVEA
jgi:glutathione S-transferase